MAGSSTFPEIVDNKTALQDGIDYMEADNVNNAYVPITSTQTFIGANGKGASWSTDMLDFMANGMPVITWSSASALTMQAGAVFIKSSGQTNRLMRRNTGTLTINGSSLDTGTMTTGYYDIYVLADSSGSTFTVKICLLGNTPSGATNYEKYGWLYNESVGSFDVTKKYFGHYKHNGRESLPNRVSRSGTDDITETSTSYVVMPNTQIRFVCTGKRPVKVKYTAPTLKNGNPQVLKIDIDGAEKKKTTHLVTDAMITPLTLMHDEALSSGGHTIEIYWKASSASTIYQRGSTDGERFTEAEEV